MAKKKARKGFLLNLVLFPFKLFLALFLPFFILIRTSVFLYDSWGWHPWLALGVGVSLTFLILFYYVGWLYKRLSGKEKIKPIARRRHLKFALAIVVFFCGYALIYISGSNAKTEAVRGEYTSLHPFLRLAVSSLSLLDRDLVVTDMSRTHSDYGKMGMKALNNSLHYVQKDGYVHAVDLRTNGRAEWRNSILKFYFKILGFNTLRHGGTGDHLHVTLQYGATKL